MNQKKKGSMCGTKTSPTVTRERPPCVIPFFRMSLRLLNLITLEGTPVSLGSYALSQRVILSFLTCPWPMRETFTATSISSRVLEIGPSQVTTPRYVLSFKSHLIGDTRANVFRAGCRSVPLCVPFLQRLHDDHKCTHDPFCALAEF